MSEPRITRLVETRGTNRTYEMDDGSVITRSEGSVSWRNNNPGNLKFEFAGSADRTVNNPRSREAALEAAQDRYQGVVDLDQWGNAIFETYGAGRAAKIQLLERRFADQTVEQFLPTYSSADYSGRTNHQAQAAAIFAEGDRQGVDLRGKTVSQMSVPEREALADGIRRFEGWRVGTVETVSGPARQSPQAAAQNVNGSENTTPGEIVPQRAQPAGPGSFDDVMRVMLPPQNGVNPHLTSDYGPRRVSNGSSDHKGVDFNYEGGQTGINLRHPTVRSPVSGTVEMPANSAWNTVGIRDREGNLHQVLHLDSRTVRNGQPITAGDPIGTMGNTNNRDPDMAQHVHYQIRDRQNQYVDPERFWNNRVVDAPGRPATDVQTPRTSAMSDGVLKLNDRGPEVQALQRSLNELGYRGSNGQPLETASGVYGPQTKHAVEAFQRAHGLAVDGEAGRNTLPAVAAAGQRPLVSEATHPNHALFNAIARALPAGTRPEAAANVTLQAMENGVSSAERLSRVDVRGTDVFVQGTTPGGRVKVDLTAPTAGMQQMSEHMQRQPQTPEPPAQTPTQSTTQTADTEVLRPRSLVA